MRGILWLCSVLLVCPGAYGQDPSVLSSKPVSSSPPVGRCVQADGKLTCSQMRLRDMILYAFNLPNYQLALEDRSDFERHNLETAIPPNSTDDQIRVMMQGLLADRFQLVWHREVRNVSGRVLVVAPGEPNLTEVQSVAQKSNHQWGVTIDGHSGNLSFDGLSVTEIASILSDMFGEPVLDQTSLMGTYQGRLVFYLPGAGPVPGKDGAGSPAMVLAKGHVRIIEEMRDRAVEQLVVNRGDSTPKGK